MLSPGTRLGAYEVVSQIGAGGMGEVYRARDTKLGRDVAIKVLPPLFARDPERLARFQREAQTLALLNHPHIAQIYGVEENPAALVMEFVDGDDLAQRIGRGPLDIDEALSIARQMADALDSAHERGIIHRDLKPANVKVRADGTVKVLDFGLAFTVQTPAELANSPTFTSPANLTNIGVILGTAAYMAPEQAKGRAVDRRADIWAFGCVLYEMLTGIKAFDGESLAEIMHAILGREPDLTKLPAATPLRVRDVLAWCLRRDPAERLKDAGDLRILLANVGMRDGAAAAAAIAPRPSWQWIATGAGWALAIVLAGVLAWSPLKPSAARARTMRFELPLTPAGESVQQILGANLALSPDGLRLVYVARQGKSTALYLRDVETGESKLLPDTADAAQPIFSPDGTSIAFVANDRLRILPLSASLARDVVHNGPGLAPMTADWSPAGLVYTDSKRLMRIADGETAAPFASVDQGESGLMTPRVLPDGRHVLVATRPKGSTRTDDPAQVAIIDSATNEHRVLVDQGGSPALLQAGAGTSDFLLYARAGRLWAAKFDLKTFTLTGVPQPVVDNVEMRANGEGAQYAVSPTGTLVYIEASRSELVWVDRNGAATPVSTQQRRFAMPRLAADDRVIGVEVQDVPHQTWVVDPERDQLSPLTHWKEGSHDFAWAADGRAVIFTGSMGAHTGVMWMPVDGSSEPVTLLTSNDIGETWVQDWSDDGRRLAVVRRKRKASELQVVTLEPGAPPKVIGSPITIGRLDDNGITADIAPNGDWIAWCDMHSQGTDFSIYLSRISDGRRFRVAGGVEPRWSPSGRELFYRAGRSLMAVPVTFGAEPVVARPQKLFEGDFLEWGSTDYDVTRDGRFLMVRSATSSLGRALNVRLNWIQELQKLKF